MPTRPRFSVPDRREQILAAAVDLFARKGFEGTTTRQIAERARVNEAIIFRHFPRKEDLYRALLEQECRKAKGQDEFQGRLRPGADDRRVFAAIADDILRLHGQDTRLSRLLLFSALENHRLSRRFFRTHMAEFYEGLAGYIGQRVRAGRFRRTDPTLAARGFVGMVFYHFLIQELFGGKRYQKFDRNKVSSTLADIWLKGMLARDGRNPPTQKPSKKT